MEDKYPGIFVPYRKAPDGSYIYNTWAGHPGGSPEDKTHCIANVHDQGRWPGFHQCQRPRGHGPDGLFCKQHTKKIEEAKDR